MLYFVRPCRSSVASRSRTASVLTASGSSSRSPVGASVARVEVSSAQPCSRSSGTGPAHDRSVYAACARAASSARRSSTPVATGSAQLALHLRERERLAAGRGEAPARTRPSPSDPASYGQDARPVSTRRPRARASSSSVREQRRADAARAGARAARGPSSSASSRLSSSGVRIQPAPTVSPSTTADQPPDQRGDPRSCISGPQLLELPRRGRRRRARAARRRRRRGARRRRRASSTGSSSRISQVAHRDARHPALVPDRAVGLVDLAVGAVDQEPVEAAGEPAVVGDREHRAVEGLEARPPAPRRSARRGCRWARRAAAGSRRSAPAAGSGSAPAGRRESDSKVCSPACASS